MDYFNKSKNALTRLHVTVLIIVSGNVRHDRIVIYVYQKQQKATPLRVLSKTRTEGLLDGYPPHH